MPLTVCVAWPDLSCESLGTGMGIAPRLLGAGGLEVPRTTPGCCVDPCVPELPAAAPADPFADPPDAVDQHPRLTRSRRWSLHRWTDRSSSWRRRLRAWCRRRARAVGSGFGATGCAGFLVVSWATRFVVSPAARFVVSPAAFFAVSCGASAACAAFTPNTRARQRAVRPAEALRLRRGRAAACEYTAGFIARFAGVSFVSRDRLLVLVHGCLDTPPRRSRSRFCISQTPSSRSPRESCRLGDPELVATSRTRIRSCS